MVRLQTINFIIKNKDKEKYFYKVLSISLVLVIWKLLTLHFSPLVVPRISSVFISMGKILTGSDFLEMILLTIARLLIGITIGVGIGLIIGVLVGSSKILKEMLFPIIGLVQTIPPVSWVMLALVWFGFNGRPAIFIVVTSTLPIIAINIYEGIKNIEKNLLQMAELYKFSKKKKIIHIIFPSIVPYFKSAFKIALGSGWKTAVMGEVLTTSDGIGGMIKLARLNVEAENIIAWSLITALLFFISDFILGKLFFREEYI